MIDPSSSDLEISPTPVVMQAARQFAQVFAETAAWQAFEQAYFCFRQDGEARDAQQAYQHKQAELKAVLMLGAASDEDLQELVALKAQFYSQPTVLRYIQTQEALIALSQELGDQISQAIGLDFGRSCKTGGCCG